MRDSSDQQRSTNTSKRRYVPPALTARGCLQSLTGTPEAVTGNADDTDSPD